MMENEYRLYVIQQAIRSPYYEYTLFDLIYISSSQVDCHHNSLIKRSIVFSQFAFI